jgi:cyclopropane-fatty-acyl-phospholipid synthase
LVALIDKFLGKLIRTGSLTLVMPDGSRNTYGPGGGQSVTIRFTDRKLAFDLVRNPRLAIGEAYMDGRVIVEEGTILDLLEIVTQSNPWERGGKGKALGKGRIAKLKALVERNTPRRSRQNVAHHYDVGNELYRLFLDEDLQYSCAYFTDPGNSLEQAQADKKAHIAAKLYLKPGQRVLDIGCGWGGLALYLNRVADVDVLGVTLSEEQLKVARQRAKEAGVADRVKFELIDYRALEGSFDRIVSVGMFEHVGAPHYHEFYRKCRDLLAPNGVMLLHTIGKLGKAAAAHDPFIAKYIFPGGHLPSLSEMSGASQDARLIVSDIETLRLHYALTGREWLRRFKAARKDVVRLYDERFFRMWEFYLSGVIVFFESGGGCNYQVQYIRDRRALPITRDYMAEAEARYRKIGGKPAKPKVKRAAPRRRPQTAT